MSIHIHHPIRIASGLTIIIFALLACNPVPREAPSKLDANNLAFIYNPGATSLHPLLGVYHTSDSITEFYIGLIPSELLFSQANVAGDFLTQLKIHYELNELQSSGQRQLADSGTNVYTLRKEQLRGIFITSIAFHAELSKSYTLRIYITDLVRKKSTQSFLLVDKRSPFSHQNFKVTTNSFSYTILSRYVKLGQSFRIQYRNQSVHSIRVDYYANEKPYPRPMFAAGNEIPAVVQPDSSWMYEINDSLPFIASREGMFFFRADTMQDEGLSIYCFGNYYPQMKTTEELADPLAYLCSSTEIDAIRAAENKKVAIDDFWVGCTGGNMEMARELIRIYYTRAMYANIMFMADRPGWKTDRGMIFMVYGPPNTMYKSDNEERWVYFKKPGQSIMFIFKRADNKNTDNLFFLQRGDEPVTHWRQAVDSWRSGKVFLLD